MLDKSGKTAGALAWLYTWVDWFCSIPLEKWVSVLAVLGGLLYIVSALSAIKRNRLQAQLAQKKMEELDDA